MGPVDDLLRARLLPVGDWTPTPLRRAAVLCPLVVRDGVDHVLFVVRPEDLRQHAGQIAFPGGMRDGDEDVVATALREAEEEIGVPASAITVLGALGTRESSSGILVHGVVARLEPAAPIRPDPREVVRVLHVPLAELADDARWQERPPPGGATGRQPRTSPHFVFGSELGSELGSEPGSELGSEPGRELLWGLTARFVRDLIAVLRRD